MRLPSLCFGGNETQSQMHWKFLKQFDFRARTTTAWQKVWVGRQLPVNRSTAGNALRPCQALKWIALPSTSHRQLHIRNRQQLERVHSMTVLQVQLSVVNI